MLDDPYARGFLSVFGRTQLSLGNLPIHPSVNHFVVCRHRFMDDALGQALDHPAADEPPLAQVVVLGAGYDSRAYRFADRLAGIKVFEVDHPATAARKRSILAKRQDVPTVDIEYVTIDFQTQQLDERLLSAGFQKGARTFFFWEGVSMYLRRDAVKATLQTLAELGGPGSDLTMDYWFYLDHPSVSATAMRLSAGFLHLLAEPILFSMHPEDCPDFMRKNGWAVAAIGTAKELERRYLPDGRRVYPAGYVVAAKKA